jgi:hypothetical protein
MGKVRRSPAVPGPVLKVRLEDNLGEPLANAVYGFSWREIPGHHVASQTDDHGVLMEPIPPGAATAEVKLQDPSWTVVITVATYPAPPPADGLAARLNNLQMIALAPSAVLTAIDPHELSLALQRYKALKGLDPSTTVDQASPKLVDDHDHL